LKTLYTAIVGQYDYLKPIQQPQSEPWKFICYTDQPEDSVVFDLYRDQPEHLKLWEIRRIETDPALSDTKNARKIKILYHKYVESEISIWLDGTFFVNTDLRLWAESYIKDRHFVTVYHPFDDCLYVDGFACMNGGRGDKWELMEQLAAYRKMGIPENNGLISSGVLMRRLTPKVIEACEAWWEQVEKYSERDQIAFGYVNWKYPGVHKSIKWNYTIQKEFQHCPHRHKPWAEARVRQMAGL
jgi:hypothetical protein